MFNYFGSKSKLVHLYPRPLYDRIIEPFAGSARYALRYYERDVWINDLDPVIYEVWKWIQGASKDDIRGLPKLKQGDDIRKMSQLSDVERMLLSFIVNPGGTGRAWTVTGWSGNGRSCDRLKARMLRYQGRLRHWRITNLNYDELPNVRATWFVDPPYSGEEYKRYYTADLDYGVLADWCLARKGQLMVCEGTGADWLPFKLLRRTNGRVLGKMKRKSGKKFVEEMLYYRSDRKDGFGLI